MAGDCALRSSFELLETEIPGHFGFTKLEYLEVSADIKTGLNCIFLVNLQNASSYQS